MDDQDRHNRTMARIAAFDAVKSLSLNDRLTMAEKVYAWANNLEMPRLPDTDDMTVRQAVDIVTRASNPESQASMTFGEMMLVGKANAVLAREFVGNKK